jgi:hypothetical protein
LLASFLQLVPASTRYAGIPGRLVAAGFAIESIALSDMLARTRRADVVFGLEPR